MTVNPYQQRRRPTRLSPLRESITQQKVERDTEIVSSLKKALNKAQSQVIKARLRPKLHGFKQAQIDADSRNHPNGG